MKNPFILSNILGAFVVGAFVVGAGVVAAGGAGVGLCKNSSRSAKSFFSSGDSSGGGAGAILLGQPLGLAGADGLAGG